jgi:hypothetical protein
MGRERADEKKIERVMDYARRSRARGAQRFVEEFGAGINDAAHDEALWRWLEGSRQAPVPLDSLLAVLLRRKRVGKNWWWRERQEMRLQKIALMEHERMSAAQAEIEVAEEWAPRLGFAYETLRGWIRHERKPKSLPRWRPPRTLPR